MLKFALVLMLFSLLFIGCDEDDNPTAGAGGSGGVSIDHVDGLQGGKIPAGGMITFHVRMNNTDGDDVQGFTHGLRIYGSSGTSWSTTTAASTGVFGPDEFDIYWQIGLRAVTGTWSDTISLAGASAGGIGMEAGFNDITHTITIGPVNTSSTNRSLCIDSCFYGPSGRWLWAPGGEPSWSGPHCYTIQ